MSLESTQDVDGKIVQKNHVVQITDMEHHWFPALVVVEEPKVFGFQGYVWMVNNSRTEPNGRAYIRLEKNQYRVVGYAHVVADDGGGE